MEGRILIVGLGAIGCRVLCFLKNFHGLTLCDYDIVLGENLERQPLYSEQDIGRLKVEVAKERLDLDCEIITEPFKPEHFHHDIIIDCTDNLNVRLVMNDVSRKHNIPLVVATASKNRGYVFPSRGNPCWQCIALGKVAQDDCSTDVEKDVLDKVAELQALIVKAFLTGNTPLRELYEVRDGKTRTIQVKQNNNCKACQGIFNYLEHDFSMEFCKGSNKLQARPRSPKILDLKSLEGEIIREYPTAVELKLENGSVLVHKHGLLEFKKVPEETAKQFAQRLL